MSEEERIITPPEAPQEGTASVAPEAPAMPVEPVVEPPVETPAGPSPNTATPSQPSNGSRW